MFEWLNICFFDLILYTVLVAGAVANINRMVAKGDSKNTLQGLQAPSAGLRAVLSECAETYQAELAQSQTNNASQGNDLFSKYPQNWVVDQWETYFSVLTLIVSFIASYWTLFSPGSTDSVWVKHCFKDRYDYYYNLETGHGSWEEPEGFKHSVDHLSKEEIQVLAAVATVKLIIHITSHHTFFP